MKKIVLIFALLLALLAFYFLNSEKKQKIETIKIGYVGSLSGKYSVLGNAIRNGAILGFEELNYRVGNKKLELIYRDDKQDEKLNKEIIDEFISKGVKIIIGNVTSTMSSKTVKILDNYPDINMISGASATNSLSQLDDSFFRVHLANNAQRFDYITKYLLDRNYKNIVGIFDPANPAYTKDFLMNFEKKFIENGGKKYLDFYSSREELDVLANKIKKNNPDLIVICANSVDSGKVVQYLRINGIDTKVFSSEWAMTNEFIQNGGRKVDGVLFNIDFDNTSLEPKFINFKAKYMEKFSTQASIFAVKGYEISQIIIDVLRNNSDKDFKKVILEKRVFEGVQDKIIFDKYGDISKKTYIFEVQNGQFKRID